MPFLIPYYNIRYGSAISIYEKTSFFLLLLHSPFTIFAV